VNVAHAQLTPDISAGATLAFLGVGWGGLIVASALPAALHLGLLGRLPVPDVVMLVVLFVGLAGRGSVGAVCALATALGYLGDLFGCSPKGLQLIACVALVLVGRAASSRLLVRGVLATALIAFLFALGFGVLVVALRAASGAAAELADAREVLLAAASTSIAAPPIFYVLRRIDRAFHRETRSLAVGA
jgi:rod shape-determining protein MreD